MARITIPSEKDKMVSNLVELYGSLKEGSRIEFEDYTLTEIADDLGYHVSQFSRILNPPLGEEKGTDSYRRVIQRLEPLIENVRLKAQQKNKALTLTWFRRIAIGLGIICFTLASLLLLQSTASSSSHDANEHRLTKDEMDGVIAFECKYIQYRLATAVTLFHTSLKDGIYSEETLPTILEELEKEMYDAVLEGRRMMKQTGAIAPNGETVYDIMVRAADNNIEGNFAEAIPILTDVSLPTQDVQILITKKIAALQTKNKNRVDQFLLEK